MWVRAQGWTVTLRWLWLFMPLAGNPVGVEGKRVCSARRLKAKHSTTFAPCCEEVAWGSGLCLQRPVPQGPQPAGLKLALKSRPGRVTATNPPTYKQENKTPHGIETETLDHGLCHPAAQASRASAELGSWGSLAGLQARQTLAWRFCFPPGQAPGPGGLLRRLFGAAAGASSLLTSQRLWTAGSADALPKAW